MLLLSFKEYLSAFEDKTDLSKKYRNYLQYSSFLQGIELFKINPENIIIYYQVVLTTKETTDGNRSVLEN